MSNESLSHVWRPLGFEGEDAAGYDALHDGVPSWMAESFWDWMGSRFRHTQRYGSGSRVLFREPLLRDVERICRLTIPYKGTSTPSEGMRVVRGLVTHSKAELRVADYLLSREDNPAVSDVLDNILKQSGSAWTVGKRAGRPALVRRVPAGVQANADSVMASSGLAGERLASAWERAFGITPDPTGAYAMAVRAVEEAAIPLVVPRQSGATLGHVIGQLAKDGDWSLPLTREDDNAPTSGIVLSMARALWKGHHDRHGGSGGLPSVTQAEAEAAVTLAVPLVQWFASGQIQRR